MKLEKIPDDIRVKSIKEAQNEIKEIITNLENSKTDLEKSIEQYSRMMQLNFHIQQQFRDKAKKLKQPTLNQNEKISNKDLK